MAAMSNNPNFYIESDDSDSEPINFHLYAGYSFNFVGLPEKTSALCKKIAEVCNDVKITVSLERGLLL